MDATRTAEIIARAQKQDPAAFDALVDAYGSRLYGYFYRLTGRRHEAEDLLQELFVRVVRRIGDYEHEGRFEAWLFRIAGNLVRDRVRRQRSAQSAGLGSTGGDEALDAVPASSTTDAEPPDAALERAEDIDRLQRAVDELPEAEREVIMLRHFSQLSFREIADLMETPIGTALARAHRGLARLRERMTGNE